MIVKKIDIENYKGFEKQEITFNDNLNVFIGANASGKTSILEAIVKCLYNIITWYAYDNDELILKKQDINYKADYCSILCELEDPYYGVFPSHISSGKLPKEIEDDNKGKEQSLDEHFYQLFYTGVDESIPIIRYYPVNRGRETYKFPQVTVNYKKSKFDTWLNISQNDISYSSFLRWFYQEETLELRTQRDNSNFSVENRSLKYVRISVEKALYEIYGENYIIKSDGITTKENRLLPKISLKLKNDNTVPEEYLDNKSDGEKSIITLVADIAYNLALAHDFESDENYLNSPGIVLIDEIEEHLHPNWQRKIIPILTSVFPKIQFFITTHSPQVISSVNSEHVFLCEDFVVDKVHLRTKGVDSNALLTFLFNSTERPKEYIDLINKFDELVENEADTSELERIIEKVSELEEEDTGSNISGLVGELGIKLAAYKFDLEHEMD